MANCNSHHTSYGHKIKTSELVKMFKKQKCKICFLTEEDIEKEFKETEEEIKKYNNTGYINVLEHYKP